METSIDDNIIRFCRGCMTSGYNMKSLFVEPHQTNFADLTNIKISQDDTLSSWLCAACYKLILRLKRFIDNVQMIDKVLHNYSIDSQLGIDQLTEISSKYNNIQQNITSQDICILKTCSKCKSDEEVIDNKNITFGVGFSSIIEHKYQSNRKVYFFKEATLDFSDDNFGKSSDNESYHSSHVTKIENKEEYIDDNEITAENTNQNFSFDNFVDISKLKKEEPYDDTVEACHSNDIHRIKRHKKRKNKKPRKAVFVSTLLDMANSQFTEIELTPEEQLKELNNRKNSESYFNARYKCEMCVKVFPYEESLRNHLLRHDQSYGNCECDICHQRFNNKRVLKNHCATHARRYQCRICDRQLHFKTTMAHHLLRHKNTYVCRTCGHHSMDKIANRLHQKEHLSTDTFQCHLCPKSLNNKHDYGVHIRRHTGDMPFVCDKCKKCFQTSASLEAHKAVHSSTRGFYCAECDVSFKTRDTMLTHFKKSVKHIDPALLNFCCDMCPKKFESKISLAAHIDSYHLRRAKLSCDICPAQFVSSNGLRNHRLRKHEGLRPALSHVCETCGRGFTTKALVTNHLRTHTGEQPFECETCHRRFSQKSAMQTHIKLVHLKIKRNVNRQGLKRQIQTIEHVENWSNQL